MAQIKIPKEKVAIVLIEPQNDFLSEGGTMYAHIKEQLAERHVIANLQDLLEKARGQVAKIFYCPFHPFDPGFPELKKQRPVSPLPEHSLKTAVLHRTQHNELP